MYKFFIGGLRQMPCHTERYRVHRHFRSFLRTGDRFGTRRACRNTAHSRALARISSAICSPGTVALSRGPMAERRTRGRKTRAPVGQKNISGKSRSRSAICRSVAESPGEALSSWLYRDLLIYWLPHSLRRPMSFPSCFRWFCSPRVDQVSKFVKSATKNQRHKIAGTLSVILGLLC